MGKTTQYAALALLALALALGLGFVANARAADDDAKIKEKALALNKITGDEQEAEAIVNLIKDAAGTKKLLAVASTMAKEKKQPFNATATMILARVASKLKENSAAEQFYRINIEQAKALASSQQLVISYIGLIDVLFSGLKYAETEKACREYLELEQDDVTSRFRTDIEHEMIMAVAKQNDVDRAMKMVETRIKDNPKNWMLFRFKARVLREVGKLDDAIKTLDSVCETIKKDEELTKREREKFIDDTQYMLTGLYVDKNEIDKATDILQNLLKKSPDNATYNNDLGFIWADHDKNLEESEKMIRKALDEDRKDREKKKKQGHLEPEDDKDNGAYLDSMGWVLFKLKKYKEAKTFLLDAVKDEEAQHVEIFDHLGDVHMALGERADAVAAWKKGVEIAGPSKREQERKTLVEKKIKDAMK